MKNKNYIEGFIEGVSMCWNNGMKVCPEYTAIYIDTFFIDNDKSRAAMETQIKKGLSIARQKGSAIMIGHVFTIELAQLLTEMYPALIEEGFSLSAIAQTAQTGQ